MADILIFSGSLRTGSLNTKLARAIAAAVPNYGARANLISLDSYPLPIYHGDLEANEGVPQAGQSLARLMLEHEGVVIVSPEYNSAPPPLVKNTLDWVSRIKKLDGESVNPFKRPVFALAAATPGWFGGMRSLMMLRTILEVGLGALVIPEQVAVAQAGQAFGEEGALEAERPKALMNAMLASLVETVHALKSA